MIAVVLTVFGACQKDELKTIQDEGIAKTGKADVYLENDYLAFKDMNAVDSVMNMLSKMSRQEKDTWEQKIGLKSARAEFDRLFDEYEKLATNEEFLKFKAKYADKLKFNELDSTDCSIGYPFKTIYFLPVLNSHGIYKVGNSIIKYTKEDHIIILNGDINLLNNLEANIGNPNVIIKPKLKGGSQKYLELYYFGEDNPAVHDPNAPWWVYNTDWDRRFRNALCLENYWYDYGIPASGWKVYLYQTGQKKGSFGKWKDYATVIGLRNASIKIDNLPPLYYPSYDTGSEYTSSDVYSTTVVLAEGFISGSTYLFNYQPSVVFSSEVYSRGIGYWWSIDN